ncbi:DUF1905 domain-containing protein [Lewinella lacunae]|uniref:DUF1905 domain-containing protein n=1 Tax=Neolewinella lacunae TaxID=1517758 RepID=A0A923PMP5_9BACT|nr:DUF1905 domain-containing protein [Neolewinella lacunae]
METPNIKYDFHAKPWQYPGPGSWTFVSVPEDLAEEIRNTQKSEEEGWGRLKATAKIGATEWKTAIWFDTKRNTYLLPLKADVRRKEAIELAKEQVAVSIWV